MDSQLHPHDDPLTVFMASLTDAERAEAHKEAYILEQQLDTLVWKHINKHPEISSMVRVLAISNLFKRWSASARLALKKLEHLPLRIGPGHCPVDTQDGRRP
jgi:hypothetical protein